MTIVMVAKMVPLPADSGGRLRSLAVLRGLASLDRVVLCAFDDGGADIAELEGMGIAVRTLPRPSGLRSMAAGLAATGSIGAARFWDRRMARAISDVIETEQPGLMVVEAGHLATYGRIGAGRPRILSLQNVESSLTASYGAAVGRAKKLAVAVEAAALRRIERKAYATFDTFAVVSETDRRRLPPGLEDVVVCPNGWDPQGPLPPAENPVAIFVGLLGWKPNEDAVMHLTRRIWPLVRARVPEARLLLVGRDPTRAVKELAALPGVEVVGPVPDVRPWLQQARVSLAPLRAGGGSRLKILESLEAGRPVVASPIGAEGLEDLEGSGLVVAATDEALAAETAQLLLDGPGAEQLGSLGRKAVHSRYAWDVTLAPLMARAAELLRRPAGGKS